MELLAPRKYSVLAAEKIAGELKDFKGNQYGNAVKGFVAATLTNFCEQSERFAQVVYETEATLSDCCAKVMNKCGNHISDIDVYRGAVQYYFPNAEIIFTMTIDASGTAPTKEQMAKPEPKKETKVESNSTQPASVPAPKPKKAEKPKSSIPAPKEKKPKEAPAPAPVVKKEPKPKKAKKEKPAEDTIQLTLF